ncbi:MAG TPA: hypothetical protein VK335_21345 [Bryobacteraceae bacterium]|nr:hypothetical protein [Bryobacteraceae bacterium]
MRKAIVLSAAISSALTLGAVWSFGWAALPAKVALENAHVRVSEVTYNPGVPRERSIRQSNQIIVFLDDCRYERTDSTTHEKTVRERKSGDVIWHDKGEDAPQLINLGSKPYRTLVIELK